MSYINMTFYNNDEVVLNYLKKEAIITDALIEFKDNFGKHTIYKKEKLYKKNDSDNNFKIDFNTNLFTIEVNGRNLDFDIESEFIINNNEISITYTLGDDVKKMVIVIL